MSSPKTDDYAGLMTPWKPIAKSSMKNLIILRNMIELDDSTKEGEAGTDNIGTVFGSNANTQLDDSEISNIDTTDTDTVLDNGAQEAFKLDDLGAAEVDDGCFDESIDNGAQINGANIIDTDDDISQNIDTKCVAVPTCVANSGDHRKVVSHIFGRNKTCTRELPSNLWIFWCRKHYQRFKYRAEDAGNWNTRQMGLVREQLQIFEDWGQVRYWTIALRKAEHDALAKEDKNGIANTDTETPCWERFLVPYLGANKTFAKVRQVLDVIQYKFDEEEYCKRDKKLKTFPGVEFLPTIQKAKEAKKPATKKGEIIYKKITLDQPAFNRKTRANTQYIKEMAAKKSETSNTPKSSGTVSEKAKSPHNDTNSDTTATMKREAFAATDNETIKPSDNKHMLADTTTSALPSSKPIKPKSMTPIHKTPLMDQQNAQPTKRRRLTRGYEKHGSDGEDSTFAEKQEEEIEDQNRLLLD